MHSASLPATRFLTRRTDEVTVNGSLVTDLGLSPEVWLFLSLLGCVTLFFKFSRFWSVQQPRSPAAVRAGARDDADRGQPGHRHPWSAYIWLFLGSGLVADSLLGRPRSSAATAAGAEFERVGAALPFGGRARACCWPRRSACRSRKGPVETRLSPRAARTEEQRGCGCRQIEPGDTEGDQGVAAAAAARQARRKVIVARVLASIAHLGWFSGCSGSAGGTSTGR